MNEFFRVRKKLIKSVYLGLIIKSNHMNSLVQMKGYSYYQ